MSFIENTHGERTNDITALFTATFSDSEGEEEGALVGALARQMLTITPADDLATFVAQTWDQPPDQPRRQAPDHAQGNRLTAAVMFSRMHYAGDDRIVWLLAPMAVATNDQHKGTGQALIRHGIEALRVRGVDIVITYGDPDFYRKVGFLPISQSDVPAPYPLSQPEGWLGQSLTGQAIGSLTGPARCVKALDDSRYW